MRRQSVKPLLLLVVLELAEQEQLPEDVLSLSPELAFRFLTFWNVVAHRRTQPPDVLIAVSLFAERWLLVRT